MNAIRIVPWLAFSIVVLIVGIAPTSVKGQTTYVINSLDDEYFNIYSDGPAPDGQLTLREALEAVNKRQIWGDAPAGGLNTNRIVFDATLFANGPRQILVDSTLSVSGNVSIEGPGSDLLTLERANSTGRVVSVPDICDYAKISFLAIEGGGGWAGGAALANGPEVIFENVLFKNNQARNGGAVYCSYGGNVFFQDCSFVDNVAEISGGGLFFDDANVVISNCTFSGNEARKDGGAIFVSGSNSSAKRRLDMYHVTIYQNRANTDGISVGYGGGVYLGYYSTCRMSNSVVAGNSSSGYQGKSYRTFNDDVCGKLRVTCKNNLIGSDHGLLYGNGSDIRFLNLVGTEQSPTDPRLGSLRANDGETPTHRLRINSPLIDFGDEAKSLDIDGQLLTTDQRGRPRNDNRPDSGAVER